MWADVVVAELVLTTWTGIQDSSVSVVAEVLQRSTNAGVRHSLLNSIPNFFFIHSAPLPLRPTILRI